MKKIASLLLGLFLAFGLITPLSVNADGYQIKFLEKIGTEGEIKGDNGVDLVKNYMKMIYKYGFAVGVIFCVMIIVYSGVDIIFGGISDSLVGAAKDRIFQALLSLALLALASLLLKFVNPTFYG